MNKILLIIKREYLTRVRQKTFIIMTILGPLLYGGGMFALMYMTMQDSEEVKKIKVVDDSKLFENKLKNTDSYHFEFLGLPIETAKKAVDLDQYYLIHIPGNILYSNSVLIYSHKTPGLGFKEAISNIFQKEVESAKLNSEIERLNIKDFDKSIFASIKTSIKVKTLTLNSSGKEEEKDDLSALVGMMGGILMFIFTFLYGAQVMRGVIEEKTNRIIEVVISSVKPFQLMMGKIIGIACVGLTQFLLWIILSAAVTSVVTGIASKELKQKIESQKTISQNPILNRSISSDKLSADSADDKSDAEGFSFSLKQVNVAYMISCFIFYFLFGYLLYAALFAAVGSAVDSEADTQQFMLPVTIPLLIGYIVAIAMAQHPDSRLGYWLSFFPLTSPVVMMARLPYDVPVIELVISMLLLVAGFIFFTWFAGKIYRTGILMYGKKVSFKEIAKWITYK